ncbi:hypothetical protein ANO11243_034660 [Dothideomycetidae sp. 11243]|nr:hypothetical protein ANO11243_034660 [fungal sp. No.11243]
MRSFFFVLPVSCLAYVPLKHLACNTDTTTLPTLTVTRQSSDALGHQGVALYILTTTETGSLGQETVLTEIVECATSSVGTCLLSDWTSAPTAGATAAPGYASPGVPPPSGTDGSQASGNDAASSNANAGANTGANANASAGTGTAAPGAGSKSLAAAASTATSSPNTYTGPESTGGATSSRINEVLISTALILVASVLY